MTFDAALDRLGWTIIHSLWQISLIATASVFLLRIISGDSRKRYAILVSSLFLMVLAPALTLVFQIIHQDSVPSTAWPSDTESQHVPDNERPPAHGLEYPNLSPINSAADGDSPLEQDEPTTLFIADPVSSFFQARAIGVVWLAGFSMLALWNSVLYCWLRRRIHRNANADVTLDSMTAECCQQLQMKRLVIIRVADFVRAPCVFGWWRPVILMPLGILGKVRTEYLEAVILHELAHIRRYDGLVNLLQTTTEVLFFYHPVVWMLSRQVREEREFCADELAADTIGDQLFYAKAIAEVASVMKEAAFIRPAHGLVAATGGQLKRRIERLLQSESPMNQTRSGWGWLLVFALVIGGIGLLSTATSNALANSTAPTGVRIVEAKVESSRKQESSDRVEKQDESKSRKEDGASKKTLAKSKKTAKDENKVNKKRRQLKDALTESALLFLYSQHKSDPNFGLANAHRRGAQALVGLALLRAGVNPKDETVDSITRDLGNTKAKMVYEASLELLFRLELGRNEKKQQARAKELAQLLVDSAVQSGRNTGMWSYQAGKTNNQRSDHSNSAFAVWALASAARSGIKIDKAVFKKAADQLLSAQSPDGGWAYISGIHQSTGSMTSAGLASLVACSNCADGYRKKEVTLATERAVKWLSKNFSLTTNPKSSNNWHKYYLMHFSRALAEAGIEKLGEHNVRLELLQFLKSDQGKRGEWNERAGGLSASIPTSMILLAIHERKPVSIRQISKPKMDE